MNSSDVFGSFEGSLPRFAAFFVSPNGVRLKARNARTRGRGRRKMEFVESQLKTTPTWSRYKQLRPTHVRCKVVYHESSFWSPAKCTTIGCLSMSGHKKASMGLQAISMWYVPGAPPKKPVKHKDFPLRTPDLSRENQACDVGTSPSSKSPRTHLHTGCPGTQY